MLGPLYTTIDALREDESDRHLVNNVVVRSNGVITDADVSEKIHRMINKASRRFDGYIRGYVEVPFLDDETTLTGTASVDNKSMTVKGVLTQFTLELEPGDIFVFDNRLEAICVVAAITNDTELTLKYEFYGATIPVADPVTMTLLETTVPAEVEEVVRNYSLYRIWNMKARDDDRNPWNEAKAEMKELADRIQKGLYRFDTIKGEEIDEKEVLYDDTAKTMTSESFEGFIDLKP